MVSVEQKAKYAMRLPATHYDDVCDAISQKFVLPKLSCVLFSAALFLIPTLIGSSDPHAKELETV